MTDQEYEFVLRNEDGYQEEIVLRLPRVTAIIGRCVAKPELVAWAYWRTIDSVSGLINSVPSLDDLSTLETLSDASTLDEWLRRNRARPEDLRDEAAGRGRGVHSVLESLALAQLQGDDDDDMADQILASRPETFDAGVANWWRETMPEVVASERVVWRLGPHGGYAGRLDLLTRDGVIDLKTRKKPDVYATDELQASMYTEAWKEMWPIVGPNGAMGTFVLVVMPDGTWHERAVDSRRDVVDSILMVDEYLREREPKEPEERR